MTWIQREESEDEDNVTFILELQSKLRLVFCVQMVELLGAKKKIFFSALRQDEESHIGVTKVGMLMLVGDLVH